MVFNHKLREAVVFPIREVSLDELTMNFTILMAIISFIIGTDLSCSPHAINFTRKT